MKQLMLLVEESQASKEAKAKGLEYLSFGRYGKNGQQTHAVKNGRLVPIASGGKTASGKDVSGPGEPKQKRKQDPNPMTGPGDAMGRALAQGGPQFDTTTSNKRVRPDREDMANNFWRDAFLKTGGVMKADKVKKMMGIHKDLKMAFGGLLGDYVHKDKSGNYVWPEMQ